MLFKIQLLFFNLIFRYFNFGYPFGILKWSSKEHYQKLYFDVRNTEYPQIENFERKYNHKIEKNFLDDLALNTQIVIKKSPLNYQHGRLLYCTLVDYIKRKNIEKISVLETGTARGFSAVCMAKAIKDCKIQGMISTIDILPHNKKMIWNCISDCSGKFSRCDILNKWRDETNIIDFKEGKSKQILPKFGEKRFNFCFLDSAHNFEDVEFEYNFVKKNQRTDDIIFLDDYTPGQFDGVVKLVEMVKIENLYIVETIFSTDKRGYAILRKK